MAAITVDEIKKMLEEKWIRDLVVNHIPQPFQYDFFSGKFSLARNKLILSTIGWYYRIEDSVLDILKYIKDLKNGNEPNVRFKYNIGSVLRQEIGFEFLINKVQSLEKQIKELQKLNPSQNDGKKSVETPGEEVKKEVNDMDVYKNVCEKIARKNQYYRIYIYVKNEYCQISFYNAKFQKVKNFSGPNGKKCFRPNKKLVDRDMHVLYENDHIVIHINGITEPDVYAVIDKLKEEHGLS